MKSWVELDPERAPLVRWAFEQYGSGQVTINELVITLRERGLTTRPGPESPAREISYNTLNNMLKNPYYMGVVVYQGARYQGNHPALVSPELWLRVQDTLAKNNHAGEKDRKYPH